MIHIDESKGKIEINGTGLTILTELAVARKAVLDMLPEEMRNKASELLREAEKAVDIFGDTDAGHLTN